MHKHNMTQTIFRLKAILILLIFAAACSAQVQQTGQPSLQASSPVPSMTVASTRLPPVTPEITSTPISTSTPSPVPSPITWKIPEGSGTNLRAIHLGGNWGSNVNAFVDLPEEYFLYLRDLNVNWVGISIPIYVFDTMDSQVKRLYSNVPFPTQTDDELVKLIHAFHQHGFHVYLTLALEKVNNPRQGEMPVDRWTLGYTGSMSNWDTPVPNSKWPWLPSHPDHARFVEEFYKTYTDQAAHFAQIAQSENTEMFSLGTETDYLFRTKPFPGSPGDFHQELKQMVDAVRAVYHGKLTYDMWYRALVDPDSYGSGMDSMWSDLDLDCIGISAYFDLMKTQPNNIPSVEDLGKIWDRIFTQFLIPLQKRNPGKDIFFLEFGYTDSTGSVVKPNSDEFNNYIFTDKNSDKLDDGEETQANIYEAFFNAVDSHPGLLKGAFLWGNMMSSDKQWNENEFGDKTMRMFMIRGRLSEEIVRKR